MKLTEKVRLLEKDHSPDGCPAVQMRDVDALGKILNWADAYPLEVFPEPDFARAHELLSAGGMTLDAISASNMRHVVNGVRELAKSGLDS